MQPLVCLVIIVTLFPLLTSSDEVNPPYFYAKGTHYEVGFEVGKQFTTRIHTFLNQSADLSLLLPYYATPAGREVVDAFTKYNSVLFPQYYSELEGLAYGSGVPLYKLLLLSFADELEAKWVPNDSNTPRRRRSCADIHIRSTIGTAIGHNEDADPAVKDTAYIVEYDFVDSGEHFVAYTYPGMIPGNSVAWSKVAPLTFSFNWVGPVNVNIGAARVFIGRSILGAVSAQDAIARATIPNRAFGFALNLGDFGQLETYNVEVAPQVYSVWQTQQNFSHFNEYKVLSIPQLADISTVHRQARCDQFDVPETIDDIRAILGDTKDNEFPIYRNATTIDPYSTVVTAIFNFEAETVQLWTSNPKLTGAIVAYPLSD